MLRSLFALAALAAPALAAQAAPAASAPVSDIQYRVTFDRDAAARRLVHVEMSFRTKGDAPVLLALPVWTPGAYEISYFPRWVRNFAASAGGRALAWEKTDYDRWRVNPAGSTQVTVAFDYKADTLDNAMAWARDDFLLFNGTNLFLYPAGRGFDFPATVRIVTDSAWRVVTPMAPTGPANTFAAGNYHDLVDMPFFVGRFGLDSVPMGAHWMRLAWYPQGAVDGGERARELAVLARLVPVEAAVFGDTPFADYTTMEIWDSTYAGLSGLEHQSAHVDIFAAQAVGDPLLTSIYAHEIFHAWNVKRLRPAELWPYEYEREQPTPWLWMSEGVTDYYADLSEARAGLIDEEGFLGLTAGKVTHVADAGPTALGDASLDAWVHMTDGTDDLYYDKGSLAGLLLDIQIRDASDGKRSLDDVMRQLYREAYLKGKGFTAAQFWGAVSAAAGGRSFAEFDARYVRGRDPFPYATVFPLAAMKVRIDTVRNLALGVGLQPDSTGAVVVTEVRPGSMAAAAGVRPGDQLIAIGPYAAIDRNFILSARDRYTTAGEPVTITVRRGAGPTVPLAARVQLQSRVFAHVLKDPAASPKAKAILAAILSGPSPAPPR